jgi:hypothetical protein
VRVAVEETLQLVLQERQAQLVLYLLQVEVLVE